MEAFIVRRVVVEIENIGGKGIAEKETRSGPVSPMGRIAIGRVSPLA